MNATREANLKIVAPTILSRSLDDIEAWSPADMIEYARAAADDLRKQSSRLQLQKLQIEGLTEVVRRVIRMGKMLEGADWQIASGQLAGG